MAAEANQNTLYMVTGAAGFLGGTVCRQLVDQGKKVRVFILPNDPARVFVPEEAEIVEGDLSDIESLKPFFDIRKLIILMRPRSWAAIP